MILQIRATSGGGKTTLMRQLYNAAECKPIKQEMMKRGGTKTLISKGEWSGVPFYVIGPYDMEGTGGCDRISKIEQVIDLVHSVAKKGHNIVTFEGLLLAHSWGQAGEFLHEHYGPRYINAFIDTDVQLCYRNVLKRRKTSGAEPDPERLAKIKKNVYDDYHRVELAYTRVIARGGQRIDISYANAFAEVSAWLDVGALLYGK